MVVAQLVKRPPLSPEVRGSNSVMSKIILNVFYSQLHWKKKRAEYDWLFLCVREGEDFGLPFARDVVVVRLHIEWRRASHVRLLAHETNLREHRDIIVANRYVKLSVTRLGDFKHSCWPIHLSKVAQMLGDFWANLKITFTIKSAVVVWWATFGGNWATF